MKIISLIISYSLIFNPICFAEGLSDVYQEATPLTEEQYQESRNFRHEGIRHRYFEEACQKPEYKEVCKMETVEANGQVIQGAFGGFLEQNIGRIYSMMGMMAGNTRTVVSKGATVTNDKGEVVQANTYNMDKEELKNARQGQKTENTEQKADTCGYIAMGYEMLAAGLQTMEQNRIQTNALARQQTTGAEGEVPPDQQKEALYQVKETHEARQKTSTIQSAVYGTVTACYAAQGLSGRTVMDWKMYLKMGGAAALTTLYILKAKKHKLAAEVIQKIIDEIPSDGTCNPLTQTGCFCAEKTSKEKYPDQYMIACVPKEFADTKNPYAMPCMVTLPDGKLSTDNTCKCKKTNSCYKADLKFGSTNIDLAALFAKQTKQGLDLLGSGNFNDAAFSNFSNGLSAHASNAFKKIKTKPVMPKLNANQKKDAGRLQGVVPGVIAANIATQTPSGGPQAAAYANAGKLPSNLPEKVKKDLEAIQKMAYKSAGSGFGGDKGGDDDEFVMPTFPGKKEEGSGPSTEVISFADKAMSQADITKASDAQIFEIISHRYRSSGWNKVEIKEEAPQASSPNPSN